MSTTPAFSPIPTISRDRMSSVTFSPNWRRCTLLDLYDQCSLHMTEYIASSDDVGRRLRISRSWAYSSDLSPSSAHGWVTSGLCSAFLTVSSRRGSVTASTLPARTSLDATQLRAPPTGLT